MNQELLRIVDNIARDKNIDKESIFADLEEAMISAVRKHFGDPDSEILVRIDRNDGKVAAFRDQQPIDIRRLGRIPAQTAKQVMIQKIRADERDSIYSEFVQRKGQLLPLIHNSEPTRPYKISYAVFCLKKKIHKQSRSLTTGVHYTLVYLSSFFFHLVHPDNT